MTASKPARFSAGTKKRKSYDDIREEGRIDEAEAVRLVQRYQLVSPERARQSVAFTKQYRSYVINYGLGQDMVRANVERAGPSPEARWKRMEQLLSEPTLPSDLTGTR